MDVWHYKLGHMNIDSIKRMRQLYLTNCQSVKLVSKQNIIQNHSNILREPLTFWNLFILNLVTLRTILVEVIKNVIISLLITTQDTKDFFS